MSVKQLNGERFVSLPVAASAYPARYVPSVLPLTHVVDTLQDYAPLCSRVKPGSILRDLALVEPSAAATCQDCHAVLKREESR